MSTVRFGRLDRKQTLAEQVSERVRERILAGELAPGEALPTESGLSEQFGVSRSVIRDACRLLMAQGLIDVRHGAGTFVTPSQEKAFGEALLLALRRANATAWDVEEFEQAILPEVFALAVERASEGELKAIRIEMDRLIEEVARVNESWFGEEPPPSELDSIRQAHSSLMKRIFFATHNRVFEQLAEPLMALRHLKRFDVGEHYDSPEVSDKEERAYFDRLWSILTCGNPLRARDEARSLWTTPPAVMEAMQRTPIGELTRVEGQPDR